MKIEVEAAVPVGFTPTGEYRLPKKGEYYLYASTGVAKLALGDHVYGLERFILRQVIAERRTGWINVYPFRVYDGLHTSEAVAWMRRTRNCLGTIRVEYDVPGVPG